MLKENKIDFRTKFFILNEDYRENFRLERVDLCGYVFRLCHVIFSYQNIFYIPIFRGIHFEA